MHPIRVTFTLDRPITQTDRPIHLDAILGYVATREAIAQDKDPDKALENLPLAKAVSPDDWIFQASQLIPTTPTIPLGEILFVRKFEPIVWARDRELGHWQSKQTNFVGGTGKNKAFKLTLPLEQQRELTAWAIVTDTERFTALLNQVDGIGKSRRNGYGHVDTITVSADPTAWENWKMRSIPAGIPPTPKHYASMTTTRPPYWDRSKWKKGYCYHHAG